MIFFAEDCAKFCMLNQIISFGAILFSLEQFVLYIIVLYSVLLYSLV